MATRPRPKKSAPFDPARVEQELRRVRELVLAEGAVKLSALKPKELRERVLEQLVSDGLELNKAWLRRPLAEQLRAAVAHGAMIPSKGLRDVVRGASAVELQQVVKDALARGEVRRVLRGKAEALAGSGVVVLAGSEVSALRGVLSPLEQALAKASKSKGLGLLVSDVEEILGAARRVIEQGATPHTASPRAVDAAPDGLQELLDAVDASRNAATGLSFVPAVVKQLMQRMPLAVVHEVLLSAARREQIELRPEGGLNRLSADELALCPPGPSSTRLSWVRRCEAGS